MPGPYTGSDFQYVLGLQSFGALLDLELHLRAFIQGAVTVRLDGGKVNEHIVAARSLDESIALSGIKPLHSTFFRHYMSPDSLFVVLLDLPQGKRTFEAC